MVKFSNAKLEAQAFLAGGTAAYFWMVGVARAVRIVGGWSRGSAAPVGWASRSTESLGGVA